MRVIHEGSDAETVISSREIETNATLDEVREVVKTKKDKLLAQGSKMICFWN